MLLCGGVLPALAQSAQIAGRVVDSSGGIVSDVTITATNVETGVKRTTSSNLEGNYAVPLLPRGNYQIRVEKQGFRPISRSGVLLVVDQAARLDFRPGGGADNGNSGRILSAGSPRIIQFGVKVIY
jgi:hypothetical protein